MVILYTNLTWAIKTDNLRFLEFLLSICTWHTEGTTYSAVVCFKQRKNEIDVMRTLFRWVSGLDPDRLYLQFPQLSMPRAFFLSPCELLLPFRWKENIPTLYTAECRPQTASFGNSWKKQVGCKTTPEHQCVKMSKGNDNRWAGDWGIIAEKEFCDLWDK